VSREESSDQHTLDLCPTNSSSLLEESSGGLNLSEPARTSRASSASSTLTSGTVDSDRGLSSLPTDLGDFKQGIVVCLHRKMLPQEFYFLSTDKYRPTLFGIPLVLSFNSLTTGQELYSLVWEQVARLVSPLPPHDKAQSNHATDCDDSLGYEYPFILKAVKGGGSWCSWCPWSKMCRGCSIPCTAHTLQTPSSFFAIDWDPTALHLRYLAGSERAWQEDSSVAESRRAATEPITLGKCLEAFTQEEQLGEKEKYYCSACKTHQLAVKKLQIWRLPPILIIHLKRFQCVNNKWIKSHKIVDFPIADLDFTNFLAAVPAETLKRYKELNKRSSLLAAMSLKAEPTISELHESGPHSSNLLDQVEEDQDDSGIESSNGGTTGHPTLERCHSNSSDVFDSEPTTSDQIPPASIPPSTSSARISSAAARLNQRTRQISTSLVQSPILDHDLKDFHGHLLEPCHHPLDIKYNMYAMVCHSGVLGGGHYVSYSKTEEEQWFCQNDSACKKVSESSIDKSSAYILLYQREGLSLTDYLPDLEGKKQDLGLLDEELEMDFKKQCSLM